VRIDVEASGADQVRRAFQQLDAVVRREALAETAQRAFERTQDAADRHSRTGALARSVTITRDGDGWFVGHRLQMAPHALFVHWGTRPHLIRPKKRKALRWVAGGQFAFARVVRHPGFRGDPYLVRAAAEVPRLFAEAVERRLRAASGR
jgi:hypothetical protein